MKGLFPSDKQEIILDVPTREFIAEFKKQVQVSSYFPILKDKKSSRFYGTTAADIWKIRLKTNYKNSFKPLIYMRILPEGNMTRVFLEFKLPLAVRIFLSVYLIIPVSMILYNILNHSAVEEYYPPVGLIAFSLILAKAGFYMSLDHTAEALNSITNQIVAAVGNGNR